MASDLIQLETCRACCSNFSYRLPDGGLVTIVAGIPPPDVKYKAISHVWGETVMVGMNCKRCDASFEIMLRSKDTFLHIMALAGRDSHIWVDNMSINQSDHADVASQIAVMGDIYSKAECVSVLLPASDKQALTLLTDIVKMAETLVDVKWHFDYLPERAYYPRPDGKEPFDGIEETGETARKFLDAIKDLDSKLQKHTYWQRAWTFQEWSLAHEIEIACDGSMEESSNISILRHVKSVIVFVAIMIADYKLRKGQYARMELGLSRGEVVTQINAVKRLFPFEDAYTSYDEVNPSELRFQTAQPNFGTNEILGLRSTPHAERTSEQKFRVRLSIMLEAFTAPTNKRQARYEADLVCCWASMCNIRYAYSKDDSWEYALTKVIRAIRERGVRLFNFCVNQNGGAEFDYDFAVYATLHPQMNATNQAYLLGAPVFTGRADTISHFANIALTPQKELHQDECRGVPVRAVEGAIIRGGVTLTDRERVVHDLDLATSGSSDDFMFEDVLEKLEGLLEQVPEQHLMGHTLVTAAIPMAARTDDSRYFFAWALCPSEMPVNSLFVGREELNGTLVLAALCYEHSMIKASIIAYLTVTDQRCGTFLIPADSEGKVHLTFQTPQRSDMGSLETANDLHLRAQLLLGEEEIAGSTRPLDKIVGFLSSASNRQIVDGDPGDNLEDVLGENSSNAAVSIFREIIARSEGRFERRPDYLTIDIGHPSLNARGEASKRNAPRLRARNLDDLSL